jgi:hypothetical protein
VYNDVDVEAGVVVANRTTDRLDNGPESFWSTVEFERDHHPAVRKFRGVESWMCVPAERQGFELIGVRFTEKPLLTPPTVLDRTRCTVHNHSVMR